MARQSTSKKAKQAAAGKKASAPKKGAGNQRPTPPKMTAAELIRQLENRITRKLEELIASYQDKDEETVKQKLGKLIDTVSNLVTQVNNQTAVLGRATDAINRLVRQQERVEEMISRVMTILQTPQADDSVPPPR